MMVLLHALSIRDRMLSAVFAAVALGVAIGGVMLIGKLNRSK